MAPGFHKENQNNNKRDGRMERNLRNGIQWKNHSKTYILKKELSHDFHLKLKQ